MKGILLILLALLASTAAADSISIAWDHSPSSGVVGYNIYYGHRSGVYTEVWHSGYTNTCTITNLNPGGLYFFAATAVDSAGLESDLSNEIFFRLPESVMAPNIIRIGK